MKKLLVLILALVMSISAFGLIACNSEKESGHKHNYNTLKQNDTGSWYECSCGEKSTVGLEFELINNTEYQVSGYTGSSNDVYIPSTFNGKPVTSIGSSAFTNCFYLTSITIPNSVTSIDSVSDSFMPKAPFDGCYYLSKVNFLGTIDEWVSIKFHTAGSNPLIYVRDLYINNELVTAPVLTTATKINDFALHSSKLTSITIPNSVTSIGDSAFAYCDSLTSVVIPNSVTSIGEGAFANCSSLTSIEISNSLTSMGAGAFSNCSSLTSIEIPNSLTSIEGSEFYGCENLQYNMEGNLKYLGNSDNPYLYLIGTTSTDITFANINENCRFVGVGAFSNCSLLESIAIPNNVIIICDSAFYCCENLTSITIPNGMTSIGVRAFDYCSKLTSITIPNSVTSIGHLAFRGCTSLTIYCEAESQPSGWDERWNIYADVGTSTCPVVWGYKG